MTAWLGLEVEVIKDNKLNNLPGKNVGEMIICQGGMRKDESLCRIISCQISQVYQSSSLHIRY